MGMWINGEYKPDEGEVSPYGALPSATPSVARAPGLSALPGVVAPAAPSFAASLPPEYRTFAAMQAASDAELEKNVYAPQRARLEAYTKDLAARRAGPTASERLYEIGAALMKPTQSPGFGGMIANVAPVMAGQRKAGREAEDAQRELVAKYDMDLGALGAEQAKGRIAGQSALAKSIMAAQIKAAKGSPPLRAVIDVEGNAHHPSLGYILPTIGSRPGQVPIEAVQAMLSANTPAMDVEFDRKYNAPGYSKLLRDYQGSTNVAPDASPSAASEE